MSDYVPGGRFWEPQPETEEELRQAYEVAVKKLKKDGIPVECPELPFE